jgi:hypothetical protein
MLKENQSLTRIILTAFIVAFVGLVLDGIRGAILGYVVTLLVFLVFWAVRKFKD